MIEIKNTDINLDDTITCGQCFRFNKEDDNSYTMILKDRVINIYQKDSKLYVESNNENNLEGIIKDYFDLNRDYSLIANTILNKDPNLEKCINDSKGLKILKQDPFETIISYIISQNNKVTRISNSVNYISQKYGSKVIFKKKEYYLFPTIEQLQNIDISDLRESKVGFRDVYIYEAYQKIVKGELNIEKIKELSTDDALIYLESIKGIGPKVASCILLFAYSRFDVFPIDTWVKKAMMELYQEIGNNQKDITSFAKEKYGEYCGIALQYMFHSMRNKK